MGRLEKMGYTMLRYYAGGMADWVEHGGAVEKTVHGAAPSSSSPLRPTPRLRRLSWLEILAGWSLERLVGLWLCMILFFGLIYWISGIGMGWGLQVGTSLAKPDSNGFATAIYFSFVTALSIGYGDVTPLGVLRFLAVVEGAAGLLIFGCVISKLVSRRQEDLTEEIHRTTFEDRLDRVGTNLHLVFSDLGSVQQLQLQMDEGRLPEFVMRRLESTVRVFRGELQTVHHLFFRCRIAPDEETMDLLLGNLIACLQVLAEVNESLPNNRSVALVEGLRSIGYLANEICGDCVPRDYAPKLKESMNQVQALARRIAPVG